MKLLIHDLEETFRYMVERNAINKKTRQIYSLWLFPSFRAVF